MRRDKQDEQGVVHGGQRGGRRVKPGGPHVEWHAGYAVLDGERFGKRDVPYAAPRVG